MRALTLPDYIRIPLLIVAISGVLVGFYEFMKHYPPPRWTYLVDAISLLILSFLNFIKMRRRPLP
jgi:hypothetical protein